MRRKSRAASHSSSSRSKDKIEALKSLHKKIVTLGRNKQQQFVSLNQRFRFMIYKAAESPLLFSIIESLWLQIGPVFNHISLNFTSEGGRDMSESL
ncbi:MAG: FCD domain-containing protein [Beijerinckiaceae bacterium]